MGKEFNDSDAVESYMTTWNTLYDISTRTKGGADDNPYEAPFIGKSGPTFP